MPQRSRFCALATLLVFACEASPGGEPPPSHASSAEPDAGFLEFLGSVDRLAEVNPNYLNTPRGAKDTPPAEPSTPPTASPPASVAPTDTPPSGPSRPAPPPA